MTFIVSHCLLFRKRKPPTVHRQASVNLCSLRHPTIIWNTNIYSAKMWRKMRLVRRQPIDHMDLVNFHVYFTITKGSCPLGSNANAQQGCYAHASDNNIINIVLKIGCTDFFISKLRAISANCERRSLIGKLLCSCAQNITHSRRPCIWCHESVYYSVLCVRSAESVCF